MDANALLQLIALSQQNQDSGNFPSGLPQVPSLSGLFRLGAGDQGSLSGTPGGFAGGTQGISGMAPGPGLEFFQPDQIGGGDTAGGVNLGNIGSLIGGTLGSQQIASGQDSGGYAQAGDTNTVAGPSSGYATAGQGSSATTDPMSIAAKLLGIAKTGIGLASPQGESVSLGTEAGISGLTPEQQQAYQDYRAGERTVSPYIPSVGLSGSDIAAIQQISPELLQTSYIGGVPFSDISPEFTQSAYSGIAPGTQIGADSISQTGGGLTSGTGQPGTASPVSDINVGGAIGSSLGAGGSILSLIQALQSGNYGQIPQALYGGYQSGIGLINSLGGSVPNALAPNAVDLAGSGGLTAAGIINAIPGILSMISGEKGDGTSKFVTQPIADTAKLLAAQAMAAASAATGSVPYAAIVAQAISDAMTIYGVASGQQDIKSAALGSIPFIGSYVQALEQQLDENPSGWATIGGVSTKMGETALQGGQRALGLVSQLQQSPYGNTPEALMAQLQAESNALFPYYQSIDGPVAPINASAWYSKMQQGNPELAKQYADTQQQLQTDILGTTRRLLDMGITPEQLGALNVNPGWNVSDFTGVPIPYGPTGGTSSVPFWNMLGYLQNPNANGPAFGLQIDPYWQQMIGSQFRAPVPATPTGETGWVLNDQSQGPVGGYTYVTPQAPPVFGSPEWLAAFGPGGAGISTA